MRYALLILLIVVACGSGCLSDSPDSDTVPDPTTTPGTESGGQSEQPPIGPPEDRPILEGKLQLTNCTGFTGFTHAYPKPTGPGTPPPGWESQDPVNWFSIVTVGGYDCQRIHVGPFERGPIRLIWDDHTNADTPPDCEEGEASNVHVQILNVVIVDDAEVAAFLRDQLGMPAQFGLSDTVEMAAGSVTQYQWTWSVEGHESSQITFLDEGLRDDYETEDRFYWPTAEGIGILDMEFDRIGWDTTDRALYGQFANPMLLGDTPGGLFKGTGQYFPALSADGTLSFFADRLCKQPVP